MCRGKIWSLSDRKKPYGKLSFSEFAVACKLVATVQTGLALPEDSAGPERITHQMRTLMKTATELPTFECEC